MTVLQLNQGQSVTTFLTLASEESWAPKPYVAK